MTIATTASKIRGNIDKKIVSMLIIGFTRQLKVWWDNSLTKAKKSMILDAIKTNPTIGQVDQDATITLLYTIIKYFVGDPIKLQ